MLETDGHSIEECMRSFAKTGKQINVRNFNKRLILTSSTIFLLRLLLLFHLNFYTEKMPGINIATKYFVELSYIMRM